MDVFLDFHIVRSRFLDQDGRIDKKNILSREIIPLAAIFSAFIDMLIASAIFVVMLAIYRIPLNWYYLYIPVLLGIQIVFTIGIVLILGALNVFYRDIRHGIPFLVQLWMYATPIVFSMEKVPLRYRYLYVTVNPMAGLIDGYRRIILHATPPQMSYLVVIVPVSVIMMFVGLYFFKKVEGNFADVI